MNNSLNLMLSRLDNKNQQDRMIKDKRNALDKVILYSYQGAKVKKLDSEDINPALINPNTVKQDYDDKTISIGYEYDYKPGTIFEWVNTDTKWLVYLQDLTELAYFKGDIRKCNYEIKWKVDGIAHSTFVALTGPKETSLDSSVEGNIVVDSPNHSLYFMIPNTPDTLSYFKRYQEFYLNGQCWRIEATDTITMPGIIEIHAMEYYSNKDEDNIEEGLVDVLVPVVPEPAADAIKGPVFIKPKFTYEYTYLGEQEGQWWIVTENAPVSLNNGENSNEILLTWNKNYTGQFILAFGVLGDKNNSVQKTIVVESLF